MRGVGEWSAATPVPVFTGFPGSLLYVMDDQVNLYLGPYVTDPSFGENDSFWARIDSGHDGLTIIGDDEVNAGGTTSFFDSHFTGMFWATMDGHFDGDAAGGPIGGGNFFEISHPLNSGDPQDLSVYSGATIGLCVFYAAKGTVTGLTVHPSGCNTTGTLRNSRSDTSFPPIGCSSP